MLEDLKQFSDKTIVLDDMGGSLKAKDISKLFATGRHFNIQIIVMGHVAVDIDKKSRENIKTLYITTQNTTIFFNDVKEKFEIKKPIENYKHVTYDVIKYDLITDEFIVYDQNHTVHIDTKEMTISTLPDFNIKKYANKRSFSQSDINQIIPFLESQAIEGDGQQPTGGINITEETFLYYLVYYLIQIEKFPLNINKYQEILPKELEHTFKGLTNSLVQGVKEARTIHKEFKF